MHKSVARCACLLVAFDCLVLAHASRLDKPFDGNLNNGKPCFPDDLDTGISCRWSDTCAMLEGARCVQIGRVNLFPFAKYSCLCPAGSCVHPLRHTCVRLPSKIDSRRKRRKYGFNGGDTETTSGNYGRTRLKFFKNNVVERVLPQAPSHFPENLKGILWLDEHGYYGHSDLQAPTGNYVMTFFAPGALDNRSRRVSLKVPGPSWPFPNRGSTYRQIAKFIQKYEFDFNEDYSAASVILRTDEQLVIPIVKSIVGFDMVLNPPAQDVDCPPRPDASKKDRAQCAKWVRVTKIGGAWTTSYPVFEIVDKLGHRVQPYYDEHLAFQNWLVHRDPPNEQLAAEAGVKLGRVGLQGGTSVFPL